MSAIIDTNVAGVVLTDPSDLTFAPIRDALFGKSAFRLFVVVGGTKLRAEYLKIDAVRRVVALLDRAGSAIQVPDSEVDAEADYLRQEAACTSNDEHVIALARISGARLLCSHDSALHADFTNKALIDNPRGKVYQNQSHRHLIRTSCP